MIQETNFIFAISGKGRKFNIKIVQGYGRTENYDVFYCTNKSSEYQ